MFGVIVAWTYPVLASSICHFCWLKPVEAMETIWRKPICSRYIGFLLMIQWKNCLVIEPSQKHAYNLSSWERWLKKKQLRWMLVILSHLHPHWYFNPNFFFSYQNNQVVGFSAEKIIPGSVDCPPAMFDLRWRRVTMSYHILLQESPINIPFTPFMTWGIPCQSWISHEYDWI